MNNGKADEKAIFLEALDCNGADELMRFLDRACGADVAVRTRVEELLRAHREAGAFLGGAEKPDVTPVVERPGSVIGPYKLLEQIGEGGFGVVFMSEQTEPVRRKVALKVLKPGMDTRLVVARFEAERQALAIMDHPNIAKVLDGGQTSSGRPYLVMDVVKGLPITDFCDQNQFTPRQRLELFVSVCQAVQHAHQKGIIHRDLKPSNVLVTMQDGAPLVKVIDFGIAKALGQQLTDKTMFTGFAQMVGTPAYISPEQVALSNVDVDTRSDVYSLGVLLYELLTGTTPFPKERLKDISYDELRRIIREEEPPKPSTRISTLGQASTTISTQRKSNPKRLSLLLRGELDWIVMKALDKDRNRRYESGSALGADVQRYLNNEAVQACPPSTMYRFRKFARRNKVPVAFGALILFFVIVLSGGIAWTLGEQSARHGEAEAKVLEALDTAATGLRQGNPWDPALVAALERAKSQLAHTGDDPALGRQVEEIIRDFEMARALEEARLELAGAEKDGKYDFPGADAAYVSAFRAYGLDIDVLNIEVAADQIRLRPIYWQLVGALDEWAYIREQLERDGWRKRLAVARAADPDPLRQRLRDALEGTDAKALEELASSNQAEDWPAPTLVLLGRLAQDKPVGARVAILFEKVRQKRPGDFWINATLAYLLAHSQPRRLDESIRFHSVAVSLRPQSALAHANLGDALLEKGRLDEAIVEFRDALRLNNNNPKVHNNLGLALRRKGRTDEAIAEYREAIRLKKDYALAHNNLGCVLQGTGKGEEAIDEYREAIRLNNNYPEAHNNLGAALGQMGLLDDAIAEFQKAVQVNKDFAIAKKNLELALQEKRRLADLGKDQSKGGALLLFEKKLEQRRRQFGPDHPDTLNAAKSLAAAYQAAGKHKLALPLYQDTLALARNRWGPTDAITQALIRNLADCHELLEQFAQAEPLRREHAALVKEKAGADSQAYVNELAQLGYVLKKQKKYADVEVVARETLAICEKTQPASMFTVYMKIGLGHSLVKQKKYAEAEPVLLKSFDALKAREKTIPVEQRQALAKTVEYLIELYQGWGKTAEADQWRKRLAEMTKGSSAEKKK